MSKIQRFLAVLDEATDVVPDATVRGWVRRGR